jgi:hypothetical protein
MPPPRRIPPISKPGNTDLCEILSDDGGLPSVAQGLRKKG